MNLPLPLFDLPVADAPARPPAALPQAGGGGSVRGPGRGGRQASPALGTADAAIRDLFQAGSPLPLAGAAGQAGGAAGSGADIDTDTAADTAASAATDLLAGSGFEASLDAVARAGRLVELHPSLWRASQIGGAAQRSTASGFEALDAQLPGGGWPHGTLTELLLAQAGVGELRLLAPALAALAPGLADAAPGGVAAGGGGGGGSRGRPAGSDEGRCVMLFDPPAGLSAWALVQCGLSTRHWLVVQARAGQGAVAHASPRGANRFSPLLPSADLLWALEQSLKSGHVGAILAWLPLNLRADALRRLQIAAQAHDGPVFVFRDAQARSKPSPAPLRLLLQPAGVDGLSVRLLKRRGPPLAQLLRLALPSVLTPQQQAQAQARDLTRQAARGVRDEVRLR